MTENSAEAQVDAIMAKLKADPYAAPVEDALSLAAKHPSAVTDLAVAVMQEHPQGGTFLDAAISFLPQDDWPKLVQAALEFLKQDSENEAAATIISYASLQNPSALHAHLDVIFALKPNEDSYYWAYPWRGSGSLHLPFLKQRLAEAQSADDKLPAFEAMLQTRDPEAVAFAMQHAQETMPADSFLNENEWRTSWLHGVGLQQVDTGFAPLCSPALYHVIFPEDYFGEDAGPAWLVEQHPTWRLPASDQKPSDQTAEFGGSTSSSCRRCRGTLHRLLKLTSIPAGIHVSGLSELDLVVCLSCLGWEEQPLFYQHYETRPVTHEFASGETGEPQFPAGPLKQSTVTLAATPDRWYWQDWALSNSRENLNRVGGEPCWIQDAEYPQCPSCENTMHFLMQLDSDLPTADAGEWLWGSGGIGYVFWCDTCKVSGHLWQCT